MARETAPRKAAAEHGAEEELAALRREVAEAREREQVMADVLRVIASSSSGLRAVLDAICERAAGVCDARDAVLYRVVDGNPARMYLAAHFGALPQSAQVGYESAIVPHRLSGRAILERRTIHVRDLPADDRFDMAQPVRWGIRTMLCTPLLRDGRAVGAVVIRRTEPRPFTDRQIAQLETFATQAVIAIENARLFDELRDRDERRRQELERASAIQQRLLPASVGAWPGVLELAVRFRPAVETSGDFYDVLRLAPTADGTLPPLQLAVGDVAGKGMSAALVTALARSALHASASIPTAAVTPSGTLRVAGSRLHRDVGVSHYVACALAVVEPPGRHHNGPLLRLANAGQAPVLLVRDGRGEELEPPGYRLPLGAEDDGAYEDMKTELRAGDLVVFSSDGLAEAPARTGAAVGDHLPPPQLPGELFGFDRLAKSVAHWSAQLTDADGVAAGVWADLTAWCGDESHHDDMTLLVLRVPPVPEGARGA